MDIGGPFSASGIPTSSPHGPPSSQIFDGYDGRSTTPHLMITFKYGGKYVKVKNKERRKYEGGKQRSVRMEAEHITFIVLKEKVRLMHEAGYELGNLDATLIPKKPKLSLHKETITANLSEILGADPSVVNLHEANLSEPCG